MSDKINQWHNSAGETISRWGSNTSATVLLRGNNRYLEAASNISSACIIVSPFSLLMISLTKKGIKPSGLLNT